MRTPIGRLLLVALFAFPQLAPAFTPTLLDQNNNCPGGGTNSQEYEAALSAYTNFLADDFVVPAAEFGWSLTVVNVNGEYSGGPGPVETVRVVFYRDASGLPGAEVPGCHYSGLTSFSGSGGDLSILLPTPCVLRVASDANTKYWVSVQVQMDFNPRGGWYWADRSVQSNSPAAWMSPADPTQTGCTDWGWRGTQCGIVAVNPDQCFGLLGFYALFSNGFEIGNTSLWSDTIPHP